MLIEPPLPAGLADLPDSLTDLVSFLRIDPDLIAAAAEPLPEPALHPDTYRTWLEALPGSDKDSILLRLLNDDTSPAVAELRSRFRASHPAPARRTRPDRSPVVRRQVRSHRAAHRTREA